MLLHKGGQINNVQLITGVRIVKIFFFSGAGGGGGGGGGGVRWVRKDVYREVKFL